MDRRDFDDLARLLRAEVEMARAHLDAWDEYDAVMAEAAEAGGGWGDHPERLADAIEALRAFNAFPTTSWWK
jgi:hypothetical protein